MTRVRVWINASALKFQRALASRILSRYLLEMQVQVPNFLAVEIGNHASIP